MLKTTSPTRGRSSSRAPFENLRAVPRREWAGFCDSFSRKHEGWLVDLAVDKSSSAAATRRRAKTVARQAPLRGLTAELKKEKIDHLTVIVGEDPDRHLSHEIAAPSAIRVVETRGGGVKGLKIQSRNDGTTTLLFRAAVRPELVDGVPG